MLQNEKSMPAVAGVMAQVSVGDPAPNGADSAVKEEKGGWGAGSHIAEAQKSGNGSGRSLQ